MKKSSMNKLILGSLGILALMPMGVNAITKDETVYTVLDRNGGIKSSSVTAHIYGDLKDETEDETLLKNIMGIKGANNITYTDRCVKFNNKGKDIYYRGTIDKKMPIESAIKYYLDGKEVEEKDLVGKQGKIKIEVKLTNKEKHTVNIRGKQEEMYTPFVVTLGGIINEKNASNVTVSNGRVVKSGSKNIIVGLASPGLSSSMKNNDLKDLDKIVITYDTKSYKSNTFYLLATPKVLSKDDLKVFDKLDSAFANMNALQTNMNKLEDGSKQILSELEKKIVQMESGTSAIDENTMNKIKESARASVSSTLASQEASIKASASSAINSAIKEQSIAKMAMASAIKDPVVEQVTNQVTTKITNDTELMNEIKAKVASEVMAFLATGQDDNYNNLADADKDNYKNTLIAKKVQEAIAAEVQKQVMAIAEEQIYSQVDTFLASTNNCSKDTLDTLRESVSSATLGTIEACDVYNTALTVSGSIKSQMAGSVGSSVYNAVYSSSMTVADEVSGAVATSVADTFASETIKSLNSLKDALKTLSNGLTEYNNAGIKTITGYANTLNGYKIRLEKLVELAENYNGYSSSNSDNTTFVSVIK